MNSKSTLAKLGILICALCMMASLTMAQSGAKEKGKAKVLDLNSASKAELSALPGIGDESAQKIIDARPYAAKTELVSKNIVPKATFEKISNMVTAKKAEEEVPTKTAGW